MKPWNRYKYSAVSAVNDIGSILAGLAIIAVWVGAIVGWIANIVQLVDMATGTMAAGPISLLFILKIVGIFFAPLGSILGLAGLF